MEVFSHENQALNDIEPAGYGVLVDQLVNIFFLNGIQKMFQLISGEIPLDCEVLKKKSVRGVFNQMPRSLIF
jgi:hypothetical protein